VNVAAILPGMGVLEHAHAGDELSKQGLYGMMSLENLVNLRVDVASRTEETLDEALAPVTVVTPDMIRAIGARHLKDVLLAFVPGMTNIEGATRAWLVRVRPGEAGCSGPGDA
jgi:outer membrane cobalamin receptor